MSEYTARIFLVSKNDRLVKAFQSEWRDIHILHKLDKSVHALHDFSAYMHRTHVVVMDINWNETKHKVTGMELLGGFLSMKPNIPVIGLTSNFESDVPERWRQAGGQGYWYGGPWNVAELAEVIRKVALGEAYFMAQRTIKPIRS